MFASAIRPVSGSRYMAKLRATGADWGLDTKIRCGFDKHLVVSTSCLNAPNHNTCICVPQTGCTRQKWHSSLLVRIAKHKYLPLMPWQPL